MAGAGATGPAATKPPTTGSIRGVVMDDTVALAYANVVLLGTKHGAACSEAGAFRIVDVSPGRQVVRVLATGYRPLDDTLEVRAGREDTLVLRPVPLLRRRACLTPRPECMLDNPAQHARLGTRCESHPEVTLAADTVGIGYGLMVTRPGFTEAERDSFPNAHTSWPGGCIITSDAPAWTEVAYCPACRAARIRWAARERGARSARLGLDPGSPR